VYVFFNQVPYTQADMCMHSFLCIHAK